MSDKNVEVGHVLKVDSREDEAGTRLKLPLKVEKSLGVEDGDLVSLRIRNMEGQEVQVSRKLNRSGGTLRLYIPKKETEDLGLENKDLVDVFLTKK
jgi:antitoxin component of MazEF toxin-antitoxin module